MYKKVWISILVLMLSATAYSEEHEDDYANFYDFFAQLHNCPLDEVPSIDAAVLKKGIADMNKGEYRVFLIKAMNNTPQHPQYLASSFFYQLYKLAPEATFEWIIDNFEYFSTMEGVKNISAVLEVNSRQSLQLHYALLWDKGYINDCCLPPPLLSQVRHLVYRELRSYNKALALPKLSVFEPEHLNEEKILKFQGWWINNSPGFLAKAKPITDNARILNKFQRLLNRIKGKDLSISEAFLHQLQEKNFLTPEFLTKSFTPEFQKFYVKVVNRSLQQGWVTLKGYRRPSDVLFKQIPDLALMFACCEIFELDLIGFANIAHSLRYTSCRESVELLRLMLEDKRLVTNVPDYFLRNRNHSDLRVCDYAAQSLIVLMSKSEEKFIIDYKVPMVDRNRIIQQLSTELHQSNAMEKFDSLKSEYSGFSKAYGKCSRYLEKKYTMSQEEKVFVPLTNGLLCKSEMVKHVNVKVDLSDKKISQFLISYMNTHTFDQHEKSYVTALVEAAPTKSLTWLVQNYSELTPVGRVRMAQALSCNYSVEAIKLIQLLMTDEVQVPQLDPNIVNRLSTPLEPMRVCDYQLSAIASWINYSSAYSHILSRYYHIFTSLSMQKRKSRITKANIILEQQLKSDQSLKSMRDIDLEKSKAIEAFIKKMTPKEDEKVKEVKKVKEVIDEDVWPEE